MAKLIWNELEDAWECSECGGFYTELEAARVFGYNEQKPDNFDECFCMDCGQLLTGCEK